MVRIRSKVALNPPTRREVSALFASCAVSEPFWTVDRIPPKTCSTTHMKMMNLSKGAVYSDREMIGCGVEFAMWCDPSVVNISNAHLHPSSAPCGFDSTTTATVASHRHTLNDDNWDLSGCRSSSSLTSPFVGGFDFQENEVPPRVCYCLCYAFHVHQQI